MLDFLKNPQTRLKFQIYRRKVLSKLLGRKLDIRKSWQETPAQFTEMLEFLNWFDSTSSIEDCLTRSKRDWKHRFHGFPYFADLGKDTALEIGFGGGRLVARAAGDFKHVYGVDIHNAFEMTRKFLKSQSIENFTLVRRDDIGTVPASSIDFVYSFIVFQHFDSFEEITFYLDAIERVLKSGGTAHVYFGKNPGKGVVITTPEEFQLRECSLFVEPAVLRELIAKRFTVIDFKDKLPRDTETGTGESVQAYIVFKKA